MRRLLLTFIVAAVAIPIVVMIVFVGYTATAPMFELLGGAEQPALGGISANGVVDFGAAVALMIVAGLVGIPVSVALALFMGGGSQRAARRPAQQRRRY